MASKAMTYLSVRWTHSIQGKPILIVSELNSARTEIRKIEYYKDGSVGIASGKREINGTTLSCEPIPSIESINRDPQFEAEQISRDEFEALWDVYI